MNTFTQRIKNLSLISGIAIIILGLSWFLLSENAFIAGLLLGTITGLINSLYSAYKINQLGHRVISGNQRRFASLGTGTRYALALLAALVAIKNPEHVHLAGVIIGLIFVPLVAFAEGFIAVQKQKTSEERGEN